jgi:glycosyltransferase involved in cell wall biosynthesis
VTPPRVSVVVPVYNGAAYLQDALESARQQTFDSHELIVVDDGSTDGSGALADAFAARFPPGCRVIHQQNGGICAARNAGMAAARGEFIALLDADDLWLPQHLALSVAALERHPAAGLVHANIDWMDATGRSQRVLAGRWPRGSANAWADLFLRRQHVACATAVFRRALLQQVGGFDLQFNRLGAEDRDLWLRMADVGELVYLDEVHARYRVHGDSASHRLAAMTAGRLALVAKHGGTERGRPLRRRALSAVRVDQGDELPGLAQSLGCYAAAAWADPTWARPWKSALKRLMVRGQPAGGRETSGPASR